MELAGPIKGSIGDRIRQSRSEHENFFSKCKVITETQAQMLADIDRRGAAQTVLEKPPPLVFNPHSGFKLKWDSVFVVFVLYSCITIPVKIGFDVEFTGPLFIIDIVTDAIFLLDVLLAFRTAYLDKRGVIVWDPQKIAKHYLTTAFLTDIISSFPFDRVAQAVSYNNASILRSTKLLRMMRLTRILKLLRFTTYLKFIDRRETILQSEFQINDAFTSILKMALPVMLLGHIVGCMFHLLTKANSHDGQNWLDAIYGDTVSIATQYWASVSGGGGGGGNNNGCSCGII